MLFDLPKLQLLIREIQPIKSPISENIIIYDILGSTNQTLWELLEQGHPQGTSVIALQQTAGRGQWGRQWQSHPGGLYLSWSIPWGVGSGDVRELGNWEQGEIGGIRIENVPNLLPLTPGPQSVAPQLTLFSAWGIAKTLHSYEIPVYIKWPNDLIWQGKKLGGILTETRMQGAKITRAIVGVGINWANPVPETGINLQSCLTITSLEQLAAITIQGLITGYHQWCSVTDETDNDL